MVKSFFNSVQHFFGWSPRKCEGLFSEGKKCVCDGCFLIQCVPQIGQKNLTSMESMFRTDVFLAFSVGSVEHIFDSCYSFSRHFYSYLEKAAGVTVPGLQT